MSYKFLVVDDTSFMRKMATDCLKQYGHIVAGEAVNGKEAVQKYKAIQPQVVMMDLTMPEMNGIEAIKEILKFDAEAIILVCSASNQKDMIKEALDAGAIGYLMKPFKPDYMSEIIKKYVEPQLRSEKTEETVEEENAEVVEQEEEKEPETVSSEEASLVDRAVEETEVAKSEAAVSLNTAAKDEVDHPVPSPEPVVEHSREMFKNRKPARNSKINFVTSYMCNWEEEIQGEKKHFAFTYTENDQNICLEMSSESNEKQTICLSLDGFRDLHVWLEQRIEEGESMN
ncbi:response regulator [Pseudalkalibacillus salsuginis]|uniref:response regulator n=1 Tax=Pseudalkalibacillus salsuginis TaxID=2910972 RepID=UPI001F48DE1A|nr:response regulator [Pseudalkalibacillus salsuginis]MCF6411668.1 response regulator [Pseudalkalibacillus salsuginis]